MSGVLIYSARACDKCAGNSGHDLGKIESAFNLVTLPGHIIIQ